MVYIFVFLYCSYNIFAYVLLRRFWKQNENLTQAVQTMDPQQGISIISPMKGLSEHFEENVLSRLSQDYPGPVQLIFAVADESDPALIRSKEIVAAHPSSVEVTWAIGRSVSGLNPKNTNLAQAYPHAKYPWIYCSDIDTRFDKFHLRRMMATAQQNPNIFVSAIKIHEHPKTTAAAAESVGLNFELVSYFLMSNLSKNAALVNGAAFMMHRSLLDKVGGFGITLNFLTDDLVFESAFRQYGAIGKLVPDPVYVGHSYQTWMGYLMRQVRWMLIAKSFKPWIMWVSPLYWMPQWFLLLGLGLQNSQYVYTGILLFIFRILVASLFQVQLRVPSEDRRWSFWMLGWDLTAPLIWAVSVFKSEMVWAGQTIKIARGGKIVPKPKASV